MNTNTTASATRNSAFAARVVRASAISAVCMAGWAQAGVGAPVTATGDPTVVAQAAPCRNCGVVESVTPVRRQERPQGIAGTPVTPGMAIGGVVGGLVGNQIGHGSGRTAATVVGAAGGAYAGHAIEKNRTQRTAYVMHVRMRDGSMRTIEQSVALRKGSHVVVEGKTARLARTHNAQG